jgi:DNA polymerase delta subunit 2
MKWEKDNNLIYVNNILDIRPNQLTVIIGTLFKEMPLKPTILKNLLGTLGTRKFKNGQYVSEEDFAVLEDNSGRIRIKRSDKFNPDDFITGSIVALKGIVDSNGFFEVKDHCYAGIPFQSPIPKAVNLKL